jgi:hypothetical protein
MPSGCDQGVGGLRGFSAAAKAANARSGLLGETETLLDSPLFERTVRD